MTGLFSHRTLCPQGVVFRQRAIAQRRHLIDHFAECLANGGEVQACAARLGKSPSWGRNALAEIRRGLGWQAQ